MKVAIAMSGGVDSATAAAILTKQGYEVIGITMKLWDEGRDAKCCVSTDTIRSSIKTADKDAKEVASQLKIPHYTLNFKEEFEKEVVNYFVNEYLTGRTPNPCVVCNRKIKFDLLLQRAKELGAEYLATGHYAKITQNSKRFILQKGKDKGKDQSYFLAMVPQKSLSEIMFPLGDYTKNQVRKLAFQAGLKVAEKPESQEVCFIPDDDYAKFISASTLCPRTEHSIKEGPIVNKNGEVLGSHNGFVNYTIGQRRGIGIPRDKPFYVIGIKPEKNTIVIGNEEDLYSRSLIARHLNWISIEKLESEKEVDVKIRYKHSPTKATITPIDEESIAVQFQSPQRAITPGQLAVFYDEDTVIGSGWIDLE